MLVLDFDGTMTDAEREGAPFRDGYLDDLTALTGRDREEIRAMAARFEAEIARDPHHHGWVYGGRIVAPSTVDPYLRIMPVARKIFDACDAFRDPGDRDRLLDGVLYKYNYQKTEFVPRDGARDLLLAMTGKPAYVVTNSHTEPVRDKIRHLSRDGDLDWLLPRVHGRARKYVIDDSFTEVAESMELPGLPRPVLLRRRHYHQVLSELLARESRSWRDLWVAGDIFELDLALPLLMGARVVLMVNRFTPDYEKDFLAGHERGHLAENLSQIPDLIAG